MAFVIVALKAGDLKMNQRIVGPFGTYEEAETAFSQMGPARDYEHKYIEEMTAPCDVDGVEVEPYGDEAYEQLTGDEQEELFQMLVDEAGDMSSRDIARAALAGMPLSEMREYLEYDQDA